MDEFAEILKRLPHRYPFLMVDKVIEATQHDIIAIKNVTANESYMQGHFPGNPIMPGVMIIEALLQTGGLLAGCSTDIPVGNCTVAVVTMEKIKFRKPVVPGDQLILSVSILNQQRKMWKFSGQVHTDLDDALIAEAKWTGIIVNDAD